MEQVETCPNLTQLEEWGNTKQRLSVLPGPQHQGAGHRRVVSSGQGRGLPRVTRHACGRPSCGSAPHPRLPLIRQILAKHRLCAGYSGALTCAVLLCLVLCLVPHLPILPLSPDRYH